ncbi:MAG: hypothetical protein DWB99_08300 [Candidatus Poseidoniales archaeon]|nr:MAG: hypothetical protein DWB99_08300 [Candidatus Poseidoniales archaeon]|tara:strand:+ start:417 stop:758 length:342 start_codon:yes stop_codon:yes gene_type:complete
MITLITIETNRYISCWLSQQGCEKMVKQKIGKNEQENKNEKLEENRSLLVGYVRKSNAGGALKISINNDAFSDCLTYVTSDGQTYVPLVISLNALNRVIEGERAVTTISQMLD